MDFKLEICVDSIESALNAQVAGANRVELCNNLIEGGTTPSYGSISSARNNLTIALNVLIRPRGGDFLYTDVEYDIMRRDIDICGEIGVDGIVLGILEKSGDIDIERTAKIIEAARPMSLTFHRAFDMCNDPFIGLEDLIACGVERILTSGQKNKAAEGIELISKLIERSGERIKIMPGSGINLSNIDLIARSTGAREFHLTGRKVLESEMMFQKQNISMGGYSGMSEYSRKVADPDMIRSIIRILENI
jgi:copper homeostasis protein